MAEFSCQAPFPLGEDTTEYRLLTADHVSVETFGDREMVVGTHSGHPMPGNAESLWLTAGRGGPRPAGEDYFEGGGAQLMVRSYTPSFAE